jgi:hypothetical protein
MCVCVCVNKIYLCKGLSTSDNCALIFNKGLSPLLQSSTHIYSYAHTHTHTHKTELRQRYPESKFFHQPQGGRGTYGFMWSRTRRPFQGRGGNIGADGAGMYILISICLYVCMCVKKRNLLPHFLHQKNNSCIHTHAHTHKHTDIRGAACSGLCPLYWRPHDFRQREETDYDK